MNRQIKRDDSGKNQSLSNAILQANFTTNQIIRIIQSVPADVILMAVVWVLVALQLGGASW